VYQKLACPLKGADWRDAGLHLLAIEIAGTSTSDATLLGAFLSGVRAGASCCAVGASTCCSWLGTRQPPEVQLTRSMLMCESVAPRMATDVGRGYGEEGGVEMK